MLGPSVVARLLVAATVVSLPTAALAHPWGPDTKDGPFFADNSLHSFCYHDLTRVTREAMEDVRVQSLSVPTDLRTVEQCSDATDMDIFDGMYAGDWRGAYACGTKQSANVCASATIMLDTAGTGPTLAQRRKTLCHEVGHSLGLRHFDPGAPGPGNTEPSCMVNGPSTASRYSPHELSAHINRRY